MSPCKPHSFSNRASAEECKVLASAPQEKPKLHQEVIPALQFSSILFGTIFMAEAFDPASRQGTLGVEHV